MVNEGTSERYALALTTGVRAHQSVDEAGEREALLRLGKRDVWIQPVDARRQDDVFSAREIAIGEGVMAYPPESRPDRRDAGAIPVPHRS